MKDLFLDKGKLRLHLKLYNSLGRRLETFTSSELDSATTIYTCGPTVHDFAHIGNLRTFVFEDLMIRLLKLIGYQTRHVMNITDVDDKTIAKAKSAGIGLKDYTELYTRYFFEDLNRLNILKADAYPLATDYIEAMTTMIQELIDKSFAYVGSDGSVYFSVEKFPEYGSLTQLSHESGEGDGEEEFSRLADEYEKQERRDFVLWKAYDEDRDGGVFWESPFGRGRPGWHIECSAMAWSLLGESIDIHMGGIDNLFPHHENEIAQSQCCFQKPLARFWLHAHHLQVEGKKMSKSEGNFLTLKEILEPSFLKKAKLLYSPTPQSVRFLLLQTHYRHSLNFTYQGLDASKQALQRLRDLVIRYRRVGDSVNSTIDSLKKVCEETLEKFFLSLCDDLNISASLGILFEFTRYLHSELDLVQLLSKEEKHLLDQFFGLIDEVLAVDLFEQEIDSLEDDLQAFLDKRNQARQEKNYELADHYRDKITQAGYLIEDTPQGSFLKKR